MKPERIHGIPEFLDESLGTPNLAISRDYDPTPYNCFDKAARKDGEVFSCGTGDVGTLHWSKHSDPEVYPDMPRVFDLQQLLEWCYPNYVKGYEHFRLTGHWPWVVFGQKESIEWLNSLAR